ncbi:putative disease resistance RPP13-like protein 1 [Andrographis paniculata]|uniref:putative disease resistance RPP13-like protein 1 n=1 Tax=Andrographis paniculata TaxID=175694 RepID=UPI0021E8CF29|nr:putative disease resistance RPP13-like protein 1 [Andrographis paniculata]XP_051146531.1 putative disease resistance RPP13-like protein 1 [Andrographis paniculata]
MPIGELFLSAFVQALFQQLVSSATMALARREKVETHFKKLSQDLKIIQGVLDDAEEKQLTEKAVTVWLESLRDLAYDLDDLLDEITTRALIVDSKEIEPSRKDNILWKLLPSCSNLMPGTLVSNYRIMSRIKEITNKLQFIVKQRIDLKLRENSASIRASVTRLPSTSLVNESQVYGRDEDKETIIDMLLGGNEASHNDVSVIPIVGMGGIGKTTLAQLVYNDKTVKQNFHVRAWVCVSEEFDVISITKTIYESITGISSQSKDLDTLQVSLKERLSKSKFLIILDDVWNENYDNWYDLCRPFQFGLPGSRIIVTTRNESVASVVGSPRAAYHMKLLTNDDCLLLLGQHARKSLQNDADLREVGWGLAKKCKGLPLAAKTLGGLLRSKESKEEWEDVLYSKIWDLSEDNNNILPVLRLSYHHLPSHLKHLFAYCSIFPKDYEFEKDELVILWMGEGFLEQPKDRKTKEELGLEYFNELVSRSFFQRMSPADSNFVMHDLINDLAQFVAGGTCYRLDEKMDTNLEYQIPEKVRHGSFLRHEYEVFRKFRAFYRVQGLRTFIPMPVQNSLVWPPFYLSNRILVELVPKLHSLRVLSLSGYSITELPSSICDLIHLRYLNLSGTSIETLPDSLGDLFQLQTLSLSNCRFISKLPPALGNLSNLRHLNNANTDKLKDMPVEIGKLKNLQTLPKIVLSRSRGLGLRELRDLKLLRGTLAIFELQNITDLEDVKEANLRAKQDLDELQLNWGSDIGSSPGRPSEEEVMDLLHPHENLKSLKIEYYRGLTFPTWVGDPLFGKLSSVSIHSCLGCMSLPPLGRMRDLKHLRIGNMPKVKCIGGDFYGSEASVPFPKLETLRFDNLPEWEKWTGFDEGAAALIQFPKLLELAMFKCDKLTDISPLSFPVLRQLDLEECSMVLLERFSSLESLSYLKIEAVAGLSHLPTRLIQSLKSLEVLECCNCSELLSVWPDEIQPECLARLRRLVVADCLQLGSLGQGDQQLPCKLEVLELFRCGNLVSLPDDLSERSSLRELIIKNCVKFTAFPQTGIPPMLKRLEILSCNALESLPWNITDLERLEIKECSSLRTWATRSFPITLKKLSIKNCAQLEAVSEDMFPWNSDMLLEDLSLCNWRNLGNLLQHLHAFSHLAELYLSGCYGLKHFPEHGLPPGLRSLSLEDCANLKSLPAKVRNMKSLVLLEIRSCPRLDNFPTCDLPPNLASLRIWDSKKFRPLSDWGLHRLTSLREFSLCGGFKEVDLLGDDDSLFPESLVTFSIARFPKLTSLCKVLENLSSLRHLSIMNCGNLHSLPSESLLGRLWHLEISDCPILKPRCLKDRGDYWNKIRGIPCVEIDGTYVYRHPQN